MLTLTLTNTSGMPISPGVIYLVKGQAQLKAPGAAGSHAFTQLCLTGNPSSRSIELQADPRVVPGSVVTTTGPILPGKSVSVDIKIWNPYFSSLQFEAMYGKTVDICAIGLVKGPELFMIQAGWSDRYEGRDTVVTSGAYTAPIKASPRQICDAPSAVACLRSLSNMIPPGQSAQVKAFQGYLPSVLQLIEDDYSAEEAQSLLIPTSGALQITVRRK